MIQKGVALSESQPNSADIFLNDIDETSHTPAKLAIPEGVYQARLELEGYNVWQSPIQVIGSKVTWINYPLLIPEQINTTQVTTLDSLNFVQMNRHRDTLLIGKNNSKNIITLYDLGAKKLVPQQITIPSKLFSVKKGKIQGQLNFRGQSDDGIYLWLDYFVDKHHKSLLINLNEPTKSIDISSILGRNVDKIMFAGDNIRVLSKETMFEFIASSRKFTKVITSGIKKAKSFDNQTLVHVDIDGLDSLYFVDNPKQVVIAISKKLDDFEISNFDGRDILAVKYPSSVEVYHNLDSSNQTSNIPSKVISLEDESSQIRFSGNGRLLAIFSEANTIIYDLQSQRDYILPYGKSKLISWLDDYRLSYSDDNQLFIVDYNGSNSYPIASFMAQYGAYMNDRKTAILTVDKSLQTGSLILRNSSLVKPRKSNP